MTATLNRCDLKRGMPAYTMNIYIYCPCQTHPKDTGKAIIPIQFLVSRLGVSRV